jgi:hypothetical protein
MGISFHIEPVSHSWDALFGSRFMKGGGIDYPWIKLRLVSWKIKNPV